MCCTQKNQGTQGTLVDKYGRIGLLAFPVAFPVVSATGNTPRKWACFAGFGVPSSKMRHTSVWCGFRKGQKRIRGWGGLRWRCSVAGARGGMPPPRPRTPASRRCRFAFPLPSGLRIRRDVRLRGDSENRNQPQERHCILWGGLVM